MERRECQVNVDAMQRKDPKDGRATEDLLASVALTAVVASAEQWELED